MIDKPLRQIHQEIREELNTTLQADERLTEIKDIIYGQRIRIGNLKTPAIWIVPEPYTVNLVGGKTADHDIKYNFAVLVKDTNPEVGEKTAEDIALAVYDVLINDRTLNGLVHDVRPIRVDPAYEMGSSTQIYWAAVQFDFRLKRRE